MPIRPSSRSEATPRLRAAHVGETDHVLGSSDGGFLGWYESGEGGEKEIRDAVAADLVVLIADTPGGAAVDFMALSSVSSSTFTHEIGHLLGVWHDRYAQCGADKRCGVPNGWPPFSFGYVYTPGQWRTLMSYPNECSAKGLACIRLDRFSNARQTYGGVPLGAPGDHEIFRPADAVRTIDTFARFVANRRPRLPACTDYRSATFSPSSQTVSVDGGTYEFEVTVQPWCAWVAKPRGGAEHVNATDGMYGVGSGTVRYHVLPSRTSSSRSARIRIWFLREPDALNHGSPLGRVDAIRIVQPGWVNRPPEAVGTLPALTARLGEGPVSVPVAAAFRDPDGDEMAYSGGILGAGGGDGDGVRLDGDADAAGGGHGDGDGDGDGYGRPERGADVHGDGAGRGGRTAGGAAEAPEVTSASTTSLKVRWTVPANAGPPVTDYDYRYRCGPAAGSLDGGDGYDGHRSFRDDRGPDCRKGRMKSRCGPATPSALGGLVPVRSTAYLDSG